MPTTERKDEAKPAKPARLLALLARPLAGAGPRWRRTARYALSLSLPQPPGEPGRGEPSQNNPLGPLQDPNLNLGTPI